MQVVSKSDFARIAEVSPGRVSQWIAEGKIGPDAMEGEGRSAKIIVEKALAQIKLRRDVGQSLGNGLATRLDLAEPQTGGEDQPGRPVMPDRSDDVAYQIQLEKLKDARRRNEREAVDEAVRQGRLIPAEDVRMQMSRLARQVDEVNGAMLADFATAIAGKFGLPQRDVLHLLRQVRNEKKASASQSVRDAIGEIAEAVEFVVEEAAQ